MGEFKKKIIVCTEGFYFFFHDDYFLNLALFPLVGLLQHRSYQGCQDK